MNADDKAWERAKLLIAAERYAEAFPIVAELCSKFTEDSQLKRKLSFLAYELRDFELFIKIAKEFTDLFPSSELDSVGLFHAFLKLDNFDSAFDEAERLIRIGESSEYKRVLAEITEEFLGRDDEFAKSILQRIAKIQLLEETLSKEGNRTELTHKIGSIQ